MKKRNILFKLLLYLSIPFILYFLYKIDYLHIKNMHFNFLWLSLSIIFLWGGFVFSAISWRYALYFHNIRIPVKIALISHGLAVFAKYIPGKIWVILGRASYLSQKGHKLQETSFISLKEQLLFIMVGLLISFYPALRYFKTGYLSVLVIITLTALLLFLTNPWFHSLAEKIAAFILKKKILLPRLTSSLTFRLSGYIILYWALWMLGFYCLLNSIKGNNSFLMAFAFPFSACYGLLALFTPGGIGVREGFMVAFLTMAGIDMATAVTFSILARLWFMTGEIFIFLLSILLKKTTKEV